MISSPKNILLIQLGDIGDVVLSFPCVRALKETYPDANVIVAVRDKASELIALCPWSDGVIPISKSRGAFVKKLTHQIKFISELHGYRFDMAIDLRTGTRGAIMAMLSGAKERIAFYAKDGQKLRNRFFTQLVPLPNVYRHIIDYNLDLLAPFQIRTDHTDPEMHVLEEDKTAICHILEKKKISLEKPIIAMQPFSLWKYKEWAQDKFIELAKLIREKYNFTVIITGGKAERARAKNMVESCGQGVYSLAGKTNLSTYASLLSLCELLISVDSAGPHIAAAVGTSTVTIYGPSAPEAWAPRKGRHKVVQKKLPCVPCLQTGCNGSMSSRCIEELGVDEVMKSLKSLLGEQ